MNFETGLRLVRDTYDACDTLSYEAISIRMSRMAVLSVADLESIAKQFNVWYPKRTKMSIVGAIKHKIEMRKSTFVRCSF